MLVTNHRCQWGANRNPWITIMWNHHWLTSCSLSPKSGSNSHSFQILFKWLDWRKVSTWSKWGHQQSSKIWGVGAMQDLNTICGHVERFDLSCFCLLKAIMNTDVSGLHPPGKTPPKWSLLSPFTAVAETFCCGKQLIEATSFCNLGHNKMLCSRSSRWRVQMCVCVCVRFYNDW